MRRVLVIGGTLFIGRELVSRLLERGDQVTILHRSRGNPFGHRCREIRCDRNDTAALARAVQGRDFEYVFDNVYDWERGTTGAQVRAAAESIGPQLKRYVFVSSCAAYGEGLNRKEGSPLAGPRHSDAYCRNKADSERALLELLPERGIAATTLRPPFIYGPRNPFYRESFFWDRLTAGRPVIVPGDGSRLMQFVEVGDFARAAMLAADSPAAAGRAYNVAHATALRQDELVRALGAVAGVEADLRYVPRRTIRRLGGQEFEPPYYFGQYFDRPPITMRTSRASQELGFRTASMAAGLRRAWDWYRRSQSGARPAAPDFSFDDLALAAVRA